jgi:hypothetical protein
LIDPAGLRELIGQVATWGERNGVAKMGYHAA